MRTKYRFIGLVGLLVCFGGGAAFAEGQFTTDDLPETPSAMTNPAPSIQGPGSRTQYAMKFIPPSPGIDYRIGRITPDPAIDYQIMITGPSPQLFPVEIDPRKEELPLEKE